MKKESRSDDLLSDYSGNGHVYEAMEEDENKGNKPKKVRNARMAGLLKRKHPKRILDYCREWDIDPHHNK